MDLKQQLIQEQTNKICKVYKIEPEEVEQKLAEKIENDQELSQLITDSENLKQIYRTKIFKNFIKKTKKEIYYNLRTYQTGSRSGPKPSDSHISTKEREPYIDSFFNQIDGHLQGAETILDIGGGMFPSMFPFKKYPNLKYYIWLDKDTKSYQILKKHNYKKLVLYNLGIGQDNWIEYLPEGTTQFDFVFMLKLVPVLARQEKELLTELTKIPFKQALITGSKEAMTKKINIESREDAVIKNFIQQSGWEIIKKVDIPTEFGYIINSLI